MPHFNGFLDLMDARSFGSVWYWVLVITCWLWAGRGVLGVPLDVIGRARQDVRGEDGLFLLDWLSLSLPRWAIQRRDGVILLAIGAFVLTSLLFLGFVYGLELAQAMFLLLMPMSLLFLSRLRLSRRLSPLLHQAQGGDLLPEDAAAQALRLIVMHRRIIFVLSLLAVAATALWGTIWQLLHPNGL